MKILHSISECRAAIKLCRLKQHRIGFVPTMGALHEGHLSLMRKARTENDTVFASIFVNPTQFAPTEDYSSYPRMLEADSFLCEPYVDYIFAPDADEMYPEGETTRVTLCEITDNLCGASRPGHFTGVATVVTKLLHIIPADHAYFGLKDYQQYLVIKRMCRDLFCETVICGCPIVREENGLAMSSRNKYLSDDEKNRAAVIYQSLCYAKEQIESGKHDIKKIRETVIERISEAGGTIDYIEILDAVTLKKPEKYDNLIAAAAVFFGQARLIDNILINTFPE